MGCGVTMQLDSGETCIVSVAQTGVLVKKPAFIFFGATLYNERDVYRAAQSAMTLRELFPDF